MIYFIGIKGTGMSALACILHDLGYEVAGSDLKKHFFTEEPLVARNIRIDEFNASNIKDNMTVIIGNAFKNDFCEAKAALENPSCKCYRYHEFLGELMNKYILGEELPESNADICILLRAFRNNRIPLYIDLLNLFNVKPISTSDEEED